MGFFDNLTRKINQNIKYQVQKSTTGALTMKKQEMKHDLKNKLKQGIRKFSLNMKAKVVNTMAAGDYNDFKKRWEGEGKDHVQTVLLYLIAAWEFVKGNDAGEAMATLVLPKNYLLVDSTSPSGFKLGKTERYLFYHIRENPNTIPSFLGGNPNNNYKVDPNNLEINVVQEGVSGREAVVVLQSGGKDFSTPCGLRMNKDGYWKIFKGTGSIATGVKVTEEEKWDF